MVQIRFWTRDYTEEFERIVEDFNSRLNIFRCAPKDVDSSIWMMAVFSYLQRMRTKRTTKLEWKV